MPEYEAAPEDVEQVLVTGFSVHTAKLGPDEGGEGTVDVVAVHIAGQPRTAGPGEVPLETLLVFPAEDARALRHALAVADDVPTIAAQITE